MPPIELPPPGSASPIVLFDDRTKTPAPALLKMPLFWIKLPVPPGVSINKPGPPSEPPEESKPLLAMMTDNPGEFPPTRLFDDVI